MNGEKLYSMWSKTKKNLDYIINNRKYSAQEEKKIQVWLQHISREIGKFDINQTETVNEFYQNNYIKMNYDEFILLDYDGLKKKLKQYIDKTLKIKDNNFSKHSGIEMEKYIKEFLNSSILKFNYILQGIDTEYLIKEGYIKTMDEETIILEIPINEILIVSPEDKNTLLYFTFDKNENLYSNKSIQFFSQYKSIKNGEIIFIEDQLGDLPDIGFRFNNLVFLLNNIDYSIKQLNIKGNFKGVENDLKDLTKKLQQIDFN